MKNYFKLHLKIILKKLEKIGFSPIITVILGLLGFYSISLFLFSKTGYASYFYIFISLSFSLKLSDKKRNDFLKTLFTTLEYRKVRVVENLIVSSPFIVFLLYKQLFLIAFLLLLLNLFLSFINFGNNFTYTIPTPFGKKPFEFTVGFRKTFFLFPIAYFLTFQSIFVANFYLGLFSVALIGFIVLTYYSEPEKKFFVWTYSFSPKKFLIQKLKTGSLFLTILILPSSIILSIYFPKEITLILLTLMLLYLYLTVSILAKYTAYPNELSLPQGITIAFCFIFPPLCLVVIPLFYKQAIHQLETILSYDKN